MKNQASQFCLSDECASFSLSSRTVTAEGVSLKDVWMEKKWSILWLKPPRFNEQPRGRGSAPNPSVSPPSRYLFSNTAVQSPYFLPITSAALLRDNFIAFSDKKEYRVRYLAWFRQLFIRAPRPPQTLSLFNCFLYWWSINSSPDNNSHIWLSDPSTTPTSLRREQGSCDSSPGNKLAPCSSVPKGRVTPFKTIHAEHSMISFILRLFVTHNLRKAGRNKITWWSVRQLASKIEAQKKRGILIGRTKEIIRLITHGE